MRIRVLRMLWAFAAVPTVLGAATHVFAQVEPSKEPPDAAPAPAEPDTASELEQTRQTLGSQIFFDARQTSFSRDGNQQVLEGEVVAIGAGAMISADKVSFDRARQVVEAEGHLVLMSSRQVFLGDRVTYHLKTGDFKIINAIMLANDAAAVEDATRRILGFTRSEVQFEAERKNRLAEVGERKDRLRTEAGRQTREGRPLSEDLVDRYALLLDEEQLVQKQENPALASMNSERREAYKRRRQFYEQSQKSAVKVRTVLNEAYFRLEGDELQRTNGNDYVARESLFTPCFCELDESPAWAFRSGRTEAQIGGYADLYHPVLEIKGVPVLYLPYLKVPLKDERQSGFLMPTLGFEKRSGNIFSQPVFFDLGKSADATLTTDIFENRGTRLGLEYRYQQREFTGWDLHLEGIRDRLWQTDRGIREDLIDYYRSGLFTALDAVGSPNDGNGYAAEAPPGMSSREYTRTTLQDPDYWRQVTRTDYGSLPFDAQTATVVDEDIKRHLAVPTSTWRGSYGWRGVTFFAPRLSLVSNAEVVSDHRYPEELYVPDDFEAAFFGGRDARAFSPVNAQLNLDGKDYYAGLGVRYGDNFLLDERFEGQQVPGLFKVQSRYVSLLPSSSPISSYGQLRADFMRITESKNDLALAAPLQTLGDGNWRQLRLDMVTPLVSERIIQVSQFADLEARYIQHEGLDDKESQVRSWRTGIEFKLPIDGKGELPDYLQASDCPKDAKPDDPCFKGTKYVHHLMDWRLRFSARPSVVKRGPYASEEAPAGQKAYFATDYYTSSDVDRDVPDEDRMREHRRVTLATSHAWKLLRRSWSVVPKEKAPGTNRTPPVDLHERARRELIYSLERPVSAASDIYDQTNQAWLIDRYQLQDQYYESPVDLDAEVTYDFLDADLREKQRRENAAVDAQLAPAEAAVAETQAALAAAEAAPTPDTTRIEQLKQSLRVQQTQAASIRAQRQTLAEPWKDPTVVLRMRYAGWTFGTTARYSIYAKTARELDMNLGLPTLFQSNLSLGYTVSKNIDLNQRTFSRTRERKLFLATSLIRPVTSYISLRNRTIDNEVPSYTNSTYVAYGFEYKSPSRCWGLQFAREKDYYKEEDQATYLLRLNVIFMGQTRGLPDMSPAAVRELRGGEGEQQSPTTTL